MWPCLSLYLPGIRKHVLIIYWKMGYWQKKLTNSNVTKYTLAHCLFRQGTLLTEWDLHRARQPAWRQSPPTGKNCQWLTSPAASGDCESPANTCGAKFIHATSLACYAMHDVVAPLVIYKTFLTQNQSVLPLPQMYLHLGVPHYCTIHLWLTNINFVRSVHINNNIYFV